MKTTLQYTYVALAALLMAGIQPAWAILPPPGIDIPSDTSVGTWNPATRKFKLTTDIDLPLRIDEDNLILDGAGHVITLPMGINEPAGVYLEQRTGVTIENLTVTGGDYGIQLIQSGANTISGNTFADNYVAGIGLQHSNSNILQDNNLQGYGQYIQGVRHVGLLLLDSNDNLLKGNTFPDDAVSDYESTGILLHRASGNTLEDNNVLSTYSYGIRLVTSHDNILNRNTASDCSYGISLGDSNDNTLTDNTVSFNWWGITILAGRDNLATGNTMSGNQYGWRMWRPAVTGSNVDINTSNTVDGKPVYIVANAVGGVFDDSIDPACFIAINCSGITIRDLTLTGSFQGIYLTQTTDSTIENVVAEDNYYGIRLYQSHSCLLYENTTSHNQESGIELDDCDDNTLTGNIAAWNRRGIHALDSDYNSITGNSVSDNVGGIDASGEHNSVTDNILTRNTARAIHIGLSSGSVVTGNTVSQNGKGLHVYDYGNTTIYHNNFIGNETQVDCFGSTPGVLNQTRPTGGNFWSDWTSPDVDGDWFVDDPYEIVWGSTQVTDELPWAIADGWKATPEGLPVGAMVTSTPVDPNTGTAIGLTFENVTAVGETIVTTSELDGVMDPPEGYRIGDSDTLFFIATTAIYDGFIEIALPYTTELDPALFHYLNGAWVDVTTSVDVVNKIVYGEVVSLSPFAVFEPVNTTPPTLVVVASPHTLWPANHQFVPVSCVLSVTDDTDPAPTVELVSLACNEYDNAIGAGDGNTHGDMEAADGDLTWDDTDFLFRAERAGSGDGRFYTITYRAADDAGNATEADAIVYVPKNQSGHDCGSPDCDLNAE